MHLIPKMDSMPSLLYPSLRDKFSTNKREGPALRMQVTSKLIKLRSKLKFPMHNPHQVNRAISLPNVSQLVAKDHLRYYEKEDEGEMIKPQPMFRYSQLALPSKRLFKNQVLNDCQDELEDDQSLVSSCPTWSTNDEESDDDYQVVDLCKTTTAIFVSLPTTSAAAASVAKSRRTKPMRVKSSPVLGQTF
ncbi:hypothetical protein G6F56_011566 [Rhizopus delemar]|nr:hypothetical protein G6F56_011566 [Rhizopus delemar]